METNKIVAAILLAGVIGMSTGFIAELLVAPERLEQNAFRVATTEPAAGAAAPAAPTGPAPVAPLLASADPAAGQTAARACAACHTFEQGGANRVGPNLWNVVGGPKAHIEGFNYSQALRAAAEAGGVWNYEELNQFLAGPRAYLPGTTMTYAGLRNEQDRANLIVYMRSLSDNPPPLPEAAAAPAEGGAPAGGETAPAGEAAPTEGGTAPAGEGEAAPPTTTGSLMPAHAEIAAAQVPQSSASQSSASQSSADR